MKTKTTFTTSVPVIVVPVYPKGNAVVPMCHLSFYGLTMNDWATHGKALVESALYRRNLDEDYTANYEDGMPKRFDPPTPRPMKRREPEPTTINREELEEQLLKLREKYSVSMKGRPRK